MQEQFSGQVIPLGTRSENRISSDISQTSGEAFGKQVLSGIFFRYPVYAGGSWKRDLLVADVDELQKNDASEVYLISVKTKEVLVPKEGDNFVFPFC